MIIVKNKKKSPLSYDATARSDKMPCINLDKQLAVYRFWFSLV